VVFGLTEQIVNNYQNVYEPSTQVAISSLSEVYPICTNQNLNLSPTYSNCHYPVSSVWSGTGAAHLNRTDTCCPTFNSGTAGSNSLTLTITDARGCTTNTSVGVMVNTTPYVSAGPDQTIEGTSATLQASSNGIGGVWSIVSGTGGNIISPSDPNSIFTGLLKQTYTLKWKDFNICGSDSDVVVIKLIQNPLRDSMQLYLPFYGYLDASDQSDHNRNGINHGSLSMNYDRNGDGAVQFNGMMNDQYISVPGVSGIITDSFTISVWVKPIFTTGNDLYILSADHSYNLYLSNIDHKAYATNYYGGFLPPVTSNVPVLNNQWSLITWTRDAV
jgi:hypothetical protein